jgi:hypothetical protein
MASDLIIRFLGDTREFNAKLAETQGKIGQFEGRVTKAGGPLRYLGAVGVAAVAGIGVASLELADKFDVVRIRLETVTKSVGQNFDDFKGKVDSTDKKMADLGFSATDVEQSLGSLTAATHDLGKATQLETTAADVARFFERARAGTLLGPGGESASAELYGLLRDQQVNDRLPAGLPPGTPVAHKTGDRLHWAHDGGIVTTPRGELLLVVLSGPWPSPCCDADHPGPAEARAFGAIASLARQLYAVVS